MLYFNTYLAFLYFCFFLSLLFDDDDSREYHNYDEMEYNIFSGFFSDGEFDVLMPAKYIKYKDIRNYIECIVDDAFDLDPVDFTFFNQYYHMYYTYGFNDAFGERLYTKGCIKNKLSIHESNKRLLEFTSQKNNQLCLSNTYSFAELPEHLQNTFTIQNTVNHNKYIADTLAIEGIPFMDAEVHAAGSNEIRVDEVFNEYSFQSFISTGIYVSTEFDFSKFVRSSQKKFQYKDTLKG